MAKKKAKEEIAERKALQRMKKEKEAIMKEV